MSIDYPARGGLTIRMDRRLPRPPGVAGKHPRKTVWTPHHQRLGDGRGVGAHGRKGRGWATLPCGVASCDSTADLHFDHFLSLRRFEMTEARGTPVGDMEAALHALPADRELGRAICT